MTSRGGVGGTDCGGSAFLKSEGHKKKGLIMEVMVNAVKFKADDKLVEFIEKKMKKVSTFLPQAMKAEVTLKVDKDQSEMNKIGEVRVLVSGDELFASKQCDTFEEAVDLCLDAIKKQIEKLKEKYNK